LAGFFRWRYCSDHGGVQQRRLGCDSGGASDRRGAVALTRHSRKAAALKRAGAEYVIATEEQDIAVSLTEPIGIALPR